MKELYIKPPLKEWSRPELKRSFDGYEDGIAIKYSNSKIKSSGWWDADEEIKNKLCPSTNGSWLVDATGWCFSKDNLAHLLTEDELDRIIEIRRIR